MTDSRRSRPGRRPATPRLEQLESRLVLTAASVGEGILTLVGTDGPDRIRIEATPRPDAVRVVADGQLLGVYRGLRSIEVRAGAGDDVVLVAPQVKLPARIEGESGHDILRGGGGPDLIFGGDGDDRLIGTRSRDALDGGAGSNRMFVPQRMGVLYVGPSVSGSALQHLSRLYTLRPLRLATPTVTGPIVVGAADMDNSRIVAALRSTFESGETVALTHATEADALRLGGLLGQAAGSWTGDVARADLVAFRSTTLPGGRTHGSVKIMNPRKVAQAEPGLVVAGRRRADELDAAWLTSVFSARAVLPQSTPHIEAGDSPTQDLLSIANSTEFTNNSSDSAGNQVQVSNQVWSVRSFGQQLDYYYVLQELDFTVGVTHDLHSWTNSTATSSNSLVAGTSPTILQPSPQSTQETTTETSSLTWNVGGSVGWNATQGANASISGGVSVTNSKTVQIPAVQITYDPDPTHENLGWQYQVNQLPGRSETLTFYNQWVWQFPNYDYAADTYGSMSFSTDATIHVVAGDHWWTWTDTNSMSVPFPFGTTFSLVTPQVGAVAPSWVYGGDTFTIEGLGFYPSLIEAVLIDGIALDPSLYTPLTDNQIRVTAPDFDGIEMPVVVRTSLGLSNDNVTIGIISL